MKQHKKDVSQQRLEDVASSFTPEAREQLQAALTQVRTAVGNQAASTVLLYIALERALRCVIQHTNATRSKVIGQLLCWMVDHELLHGIKPKKFRDNWSRLHKLFATEEDCIFWEAHAKHIHAILPLHQCASSVNDLKNASVDTHDLFTGLLIESPALSADEMREKINKYLPPQDTNSKNNNVSPLFLATTIARSPLPTAKRQRIEQSVLELEEGECEEEEQKEEFSPPLAAAPTSRARGSPLEYYKSHNPGTAVQSKVAADDSDQQAEAAAPTSRRSTFDDGDESLLAAVLSDPDPFPNSELPASQNVKAKKAKRKKAYEPVIDEDTEIGSSILKSWLANTSDITRPPGPRPARLSNSQRRLIAARAFMSEGASNPIAAAKAAASARVWDLPMGVGCVGPKLRALMRALHTTAPFPRAPLCMAPSRMSSLPMTTTVKDWPTRLYLASPLVNFLPLDSRVSPHLRDAIVILPSPTDRITFRITPEAREVATWATVQQMTIGCINHNGHAVEPASTSPLMADAAAAAAATPAHATSNTYPSLPNIADLQSFLENDWMALQKNEQRPSPPNGMNELFYGKDVSEKDFQPSGFFPTHHTTLQTVIDTCGGSLKTANLTLESATESTKYLTSLAARWQQLKRTDDSFITHALYMNELQLHRRSLSQLSAVRLDGAEGYYLYLKLGFQFFNLHIEQMLFPFIHHQLEGSSVWFIIPFDQLNQLYELAGEMYCVLYGITASSLKLESAEFDKQRRIMGRAFLYSKQLFPPLSLLDKYQIKYKRIELEEGETLTAPGGFAHFGYSTHPGATVSVAINMVTDAWLKDGLPFLKDYFEWVGQVKQLVKMHEVAWSEWLLTPAGLASRSIHQLKSPMEFVAKALNLCPLNFACSFMRGLYADLGALSDKKAVCEYPSLECLDHDRLTEEVKKMQSQCSHIVQLIHEQRDWIKEQTNEKECTGCTNDQPHDKHSCMLCLCRPGPNINELIPHVQVTQVPPNQLLAASLELSEVLQLNQAVFDVITLAFKSGESEVLKIYCHQPGQATSSMRFIAKHYHSEAMRQQESRIFARLYYANDRALQDVDRFIRQRLKPSLEFRKLFATELYTQFGVDTGDHGKLKSKQEIPIQKKHHRSIGQAAVAATAHLPPLDPATQAIQHFRQMKTLVAFFSFYRGVMMDAICRRCKDYPIDAEGERRRVDLRMTLFWHPRSNDPEHGDYSEMMNKSLRFVLHCLEGLDMHHRSHVLIGDIKPSNLFYGAQMDRNLHDANFCPLPVFGDYGHATDLTSKESSSHVLTLYSLSSMSGQVKHKHIGTWPYQAPETHSAAAGRVGIFDRSSDLFALALTILEILTGQLFQKAHDRLETDRSQYACKNAPGQSDSQFYSDAQEWIGTSLTSLWINSITASKAHVSVDELSQLKWNEQRTALIPSAITDLLLQMLHTDRNKRPTVQAAIAQVQALLSTHC